MVADAVALKVRQWSDWLELDRAVAYGLAARCWSVCSGPITVLLIASQFTPQVQGYYYTFTSLLALNAFVELGLATVVAQFASHEWARLRLDANTGEIVGDSDALGRLVRIGRIAASWFGIAALLAATGFAVGGYLLFSRQPADMVSWLAPWLALSVLGGFNLLVLPVFAVLEGCNQVSRVYGCRAVQTVVANLAMWTVMLLGGGLWAAPTFQLATLVVAGVFLGWRCRRFFTSFLTVTPAAAPSWRADMFPMQWRLAVSYLAGYFTFSVFTPLVFHYNGAVVAGRMGLTLTLVMTVGSVAAIWPATKAPQFGVLIAQKAYADLDRLFRRVVTRTVGVLFASGVLAWAAVAMLYQLEVPLAQRFLAPGPTALLVGGMIAANFCAPMSVYLRAHKREPFMMLSIVVGMVTAVSAWSMARWVGPTGVAVAYLAVSALIALPAGLFIFNRCRTAWHAG